jgi:hypothetical protein
MRSAEGNPFIPEEEWVGIPCETCHVMENGVVTQGIAWLNPVSMEHEQLNTPNELCGKCHVTTVGTGNPVRSAVSHEIYLGGPAHLNYAGFIDEVKPPLPVRSTYQQPSVRLPRSIRFHAGGKYVVMGKLTCMACHDASGAEVGPNRRA